MKAFDWYGEQGLYLRLTQANVDSVPRSGAADAAVETLRRDPQIEGQLQAFAVADVAAYLQGFGAWDCDQLAIHEDNLDRLLWLAIGDIQENPADYNSETADEELTDDCPKIES